MKHAEEMGVSQGVVLKQKLWKIRNITQQITNFESQPNTVSFDCETGMTSFHLPLKAFCWLWTSSDSRLHRLDITREHKAEATARSSDVRQV